ncbi:MAG: ABC1 kinase family protein [Dehalococcoidia bacterium]
MKKLKYFISLFYFLKRFLRWAPVAFVAIRIWVNWRMLRLKRRLFPKNEQLTKKFHSKTAQQLVKLAVSQQGLILKAAQFFGSRADIMREEYVFALSLLQDKVPPRSWHTMKPLIEKELNGEIETIFKEFDTIPVASASLAQVYKAKTLDDELIAVKVQYPGIDKIVYWDIEIIDFLAKLWSKVETIVDFRPIVADLKENAPDEIDYFHEGQAAEKIKELLNKEGIKYVEIPSIYWQLSTKKVLTMSYLQGIKITNINELNELGIDSEIIADQLIDLYNIMILKLGAFHADPHPGNLFVIPPNNNEEVKIGLVDFGLSKFLKNEFRQQIIVLTSAIVNEQPELISSTMETMGFETKNKDPETYEALGDAFLGEVIKSGQAYADQKMLADINVRLSRVLSSNPLIKVPGDLLLVARTMGLLSGMGKLLNSKTDLLEKILPYLEESA